MITNQPISQRSCQIVRRKSSIDCSTLLSYDFAEGAMHAAFVFVMSVFLKRSYLELDIDHSSGAITLPALTYRAA